MYSAIWLQINDDNNYNNNDLHPKDDVGRLYELRKNAEKDPPAFKIKRLEDYTKKKKKKKSRGRLVAVARNNTYDTRVG